MFQFIYVLYLWIASLGGGTEQGQSNRYYNQISVSEFSRYDSVKLTLKAKYGNVYHSYQRQTSGFMLDFYVLEKTQGNKKILFKMDELTQIKNDSTFMLCEPPFKMDGDSINLVNGIWFYSNSERSGETSFSVDSMPPKIPVADYQKLKMGIYQCKDDKLIKLSDDQSGETFYNLKITGFFFLPNPGFLYKLADFRDIK